MVTHFDITSTYVTGLFSGRHLVQVVFLVVTFMLVVITAALCIRGTGGVWGARRLFHLVFPFLPRLVAVSSILPRRVQSQASKEWQVGVDVYRPSNGRHVLLPRHLPSASTLAVVATSSLSRVRLCATNCRSHRNCRRFGGCQYVAVSR